MAHPRVWGNRYLQVLMHYIKQDHIWMYDWAMRCAFVCIFGVRVGMCHDTCLQRTDARYRCAIRVRCCIWARLCCAYGVRWRRLSRLPTAIRRRLASSSRYLVKRVMVRSLNRRLGFAIASAKSDMDTDDLGFTCRSRCCHTLVCDMWISLSKLSQIWMKKMMTGQKQCDDKQTASALH